MEYQVFARKFRPQQFDAVIGQPHIVTTLKNALLKNRIAQGFLFVGSRGVGKTSTARILAKALNCEGERKQPYENCGQCASCVEISNGTGFDVLEIDGASNRGIDEIRNLRDNVKFKPMHGRYKVYIIDEVHMLTQEAFNALLKTLEEPPEHVKFIFATTEAHKIPQTILSRCQRYDFRQLQVGLIVEALRQIGVAEKIQIDERALFLIAKNAEGSLRDAESLLDKLSGSLDGQITFQDTIEILGLTDALVYFDLMGKILQKDGEAALRVIAAEEDAGKDLIFFTKGLMEQFRDVMVLQAAQSPERFLVLAEEDQKRLKTIAEKSSLKETLYFITVLQNALRMMKLSPFPKLDLEVALLKLVSREDLRLLSDVLQDVQVLKKSMTDGSSFSLSSPVLVPSETRTLAPATGSSFKDANMATAPALEFSAEETTEEDLVEGEEVLSRPSALDEIKKKWPFLLDSIKSEKMSVATFLIDGHPAAFDMKKLVIAFTTVNKFAKETLEQQANKALVEKHLAKLLGSSVQVDFRVNDVLSTATFSAAPLEKDGAMQSVVESALNIFQGRILGG